MGEKLAPLAAPFTFQAGQTYYVGVHSDSACAFRLIPAGAVPLLAVSGTSLLCSFARALAYAGGSPAAFAPAAADLSASFPPEVRMRVLSAP